MIGSFHPPAGGRVVGLSSWPESTPRATLAELVHEFEARNGIEIEDLGVIYQLWAARQPDRPPPLDPFNGYRYGFSRLASGFSICSSGPDQEAETDDDIVIEFPGPGPGRAPRVPQLLDSGHQTGSW